MDVSSPREEIKLFHQRLKETITWWTLRNWEANPAETLRTSQLRPSAFQTMEDIFSVSSDQRRRSVDLLAAQRAMLLQEQGIFPHPLALPPPDGDLLAFLPDWSTSDGAAHLATQGFVDDFNIPAWDTWIFYVMHDPIHSPLGPACDSYLLSWVPSSFMEIVGAGIDVTSDACLLWASDLDTQFIQHLRQAGLVS